MFPVSRLVTLQQVERFGFIIVTTSCTWLDHLLSPYAPAGQTSGLYVLISARSDSILAEISICLIRLRYLYSVGPQIP